LVLAGAALLRCPSEEQVAPLLAKAREDNIVSSVDIAPAQAIKMPAFWICFAWLALCTSGGLALISQAVPAAMEILGDTDATALATATAAMGSVSLCNGLGRLLNGFIWDRFGYRVSFIWVALAFTVGMLCCAIAIGSSSFPLLVVGFVLLGLMFGGTMSATSAVVGTFFGTKYFGINYAIMCCQMIPAAVIGPTLLAITQTGAGSYGPAFWVFLAVAAGTFLFQFAIRRPKDEELEALADQANRPEEHRLQPAYSQA